MPVGVSHLRFPVVDLDATIQFLVDGLGLALLGRSETWAEVDGYGAQLLLEVVPADVQPSGSVRLGPGLRILSNDLGGDLERMVAHGATVVRDIETTEGLQEIAELTGPGGLSIQLWRKLGEDEYGFIPELPRTMPWTDQAVERLQALLSRVPQEFRSSARIRSSQEAEDLAWELDAVDEACAVRGMIRATPRPLRDRIRRALEVEKLDPSAYESDFQA